MKLILKNVNYNKLFNVTDNKNGYYLIIVYKTDNDIETRKIYYNNTDIYLQNIKEIIINLINYQGQPQLIAH